MVMMKKKINYETILYGAFALIIVLFFLFMPILYVDTDNDFYANGYRILVGSYLQVPSDIDPEVIETVTLLRTSSFNFCAILFPIGTFLFYRIVSSAPAKRFSAFLCGVVGFLYILFIPVMANYWRNRNFQIDIYQSWGWYVVIVVYLAYLVFIIVDLILTIKKEKKELSIEE